MTEIYLGVVSCSDSCHTGDSRDGFGRAAVEAAEARGIEVVAYHVCPDDVESIEASLVEMCDVDEAHLVITVGGTGLGLKQVTPEATLAAATRPVPGIAEAMRADVVCKSSAAALSRATSVQRGRTLIVNVPACEGPFEACVEWLLDRAAGFVEAMANEGD